MSEMKVNLPPPDNYAFPLHMTVQQGATMHYWSTTGMTLRDYFAAQALAGIVANLVHWTDEQRAQHAYAQADAMLAARSAKP